MTVESAADAVLEAERVQRRAADPEACVWLAASAGTGKTKALTDRVLSLLLAGTEPSRILCLTFTKAAAAEMANRVNRQLSLWALTNDDDLHDRLTRLTGKNPDAVHMGRAKRLFANVLEAPGGLRIATIHAFCESILKRFPIEAGLAPHFEVIDERTAGELLEKAREEVMSSARRERSDGGKSGGLTEAFGVIAERANESQFADLMKALARDHGRLSEMLARTGGVAGFGEQLAGALGIEPGEDETDVIAAASRDHAFDQAGLARLCEALEKGKKTDQERAQQIAAFLELPAAGRPAGFEAYQSAFLTDKGTIRARLVTADVAKKLGADTDVLAKEAERILAVIGKIKAARLATGTCAALTLGAALLDAYAALKDARAALDYDDLILRTRALLEQQDIAPWVLFKLDGGLDHILVDEAQDTSADQWAVIASLADEFFAGEGARSGPRTVFAVGDAKQSIYSFQRADPEAFAAMRNHFQQRAEAARMAWRDLALTVSFRSVAPILKTVDEVFARSPAADGVKDADTPIHHRPKRVGQAGRVELWPLATVVKPDKPAPWQPPLVAAATESASAQLAVKIADTIKDWIETRETLPSRGRPISASDIIVLVRKRTGLMERLVSALKSRGVPVAGVDRMVLTDQLVVRDMMALARFLLLPEDDLTLAALLKSPLIGLDEDRLFRAAYRRSGSLWASIRTLATAGPAGPFAEAERKLSAWLARADFMRPFDLFARVLYAEGGRARLLARLGMEADDPLNEFIALALAYERTAVPSLQDFVAWIEAGQAQIKRDLERPVRDEVRVMTVHGAKGLQAPIVILPDTTQTSADKERLMWIAENEAGAPLQLPLWVPRVDDDDPVGARARAERLERARRENHRLLYVAMTRAEDRLVVAGYRARSVKADAEDSEPASSPKTDTDVWYELAKSGLKSIPGIREESFANGGESDRTKIVLDEPQTAAVEETERPFAKMSAESTVDRPDWLWLQAEKETASTRPLTPSRFVVDEETPEREPAVVSPLAGGDGDRFRRGIVAHRLLQMLPVVPVERRRARAELLAVESGFTKSEAAKLAEEMLGVLAHPDLAALFAPDSLPEVPFAGRLGDGGPEIVGRIDRMAVAASEVIVADYKTNRPVPRDVASVPAIYLRQMALYRAALLRAFPGRKVRAILIYTDGPKVIELPTATLDEIISRVSAPQLAHGSVA